MFDFNHPSPATASSGGGDAVADGPGNSLAVTIATGNRTLTESELEGVGSVIVSGATAAVSVTVPANMKRSILFDSACAHPVTVTDGSTAVILYNAENTIVYSGADGLHDLATSSRDSLLQLDLAPESSYTFSDEQLDGVTVLYLDTMDWDDAMLETPLNPYGPLELVFPDTTRKVTLITSADREVKARSAIAVDELYDVPIDGAIDIIVRKGASWLSMSRHPAFSEIDSIKHFIPGKPAVGTALGRLELPTGDNGAMYWSFDLSFRVSATTTPPAFAVIDQFGTVISAEIGDMTMGAVGGAYIMIDSATYPDGMSVDEGTYPNGMFLYLMAPDPQDATMADITVRGSVWDNG